MLQLTGIKRAREAWPNFLEEMQMNRDLNNDDPTLQPPLPVTLRALTREAGGEHYPIPMWFGNNIFGHHYIDEYPEYEETLDIMAVTRVRMIWNRFILNLRRLVGRRRHRPHMASLLGAW